MHEMSIASELLSLAIRNAEHYNLVSIDAVDVEIGVLRQIVPDAMTVAWSALTQGTCAESSVLNMSFVNPQAKCSICGNLYEPSLDNYLCPQCGKADITITSGNDIILKSLSGEQKGKSEDEGQGCSECAQSE